jgi:hypothetical protein
MPQPPTVTEEDIARWNDSYEEYWKTNPHKLPRYMYSDDPKQKERLWYTGSWLGEEMRKLGADDDQVSRAEFALGQRLFCARDPWAEAIKALDSFKEGIVCEETPIMITIIPEAQ